jgi:DNA mismatch repair protein MSH6
LYKLRPGACPKSYGVRVAALAGVPKEVLKLARVAAADSERRLSRAFGGDGAALTEGEKSGAFLTIIYFFHPSLGFNI